MCSVGQETTDNILSQKMPCGIGTRYFSSVSAAQYIAKTINDRPSGYTFKIAGSFGDETAPISGVIALYNAFKNCNCRKQLAISQFKGHSAYPFSWSTTSYVTQIKNF